MILNQALEIANTWHFRLIRVKKKQKDMGEILMMAPARVSHLLSAKRETISKLSLYNFCAIEELLQQWEKEYDAQKRDY